MPGDLFSQALAAGVLSLVVGIAAVSLWVLTTRRRLQRELDTLRHEMRVSNGAAYNVGESLVQLRAAVAALEAEDQREADETADLRAGQPAPLVGEMSASETHLLDRLRASGLGASRVH